MTDSDFAGADLVALYDRLNPWSADNDYYRAFAAGGESLLDLGCGTGRLAAAIAADGKAVAGVDPSAAMLAAARARPGGERVDWRLGDAREVRLGRRFDRIVCTGHAFQQILTDDDQRAFFATVRAHLAAGGRLAFESRNPAVEEWREWTPADRERVEHPCLGAVEAWAEASAPVGEVVDYAMVYRFPDDGREVRGTGRLRFAEREAILVRMGEAGLTAETVHGDWSGTAFTESSREIIIVARSA